MNLVIKLCSLSLSLLLLDQAIASGQRKVSPFNPLQYSQRSPVAHHISPLPRPPRRAAHQNQPTSYHNQAAQFYRPNYQPPGGGNAYFDPSYEPSNYRESYNTPTAAFKQPSVATVAYNSPSLSYNKPASFDTSGFDPVYEPSSYQPKAVKSSSASKTTDHDNSESRLERQSGGGGHDSYVDFGAHTGHKGSFGWYADFPAHKDT